MDCYVGDSPGNYHKVSIQSNCGILDGCNINNHFNLLVVIGRKKEILMEILQKGNGIPKYDVLVFVYEQANTVNLGVKRV